MTHRLNGIRAKIQRADETIRQLDVEMAAFESTAPHEVVREFQKKGLEYCFIVKGEPAVPPRLAVLTGEVIHQLRSSLDHLITALVLENGGTPTREHRFPVCLKEQHFTAVCNDGAIEGISTCAADLVRAQQPYLCSTPKDHFLGALHKLDIRDKHLLLVVVAAAARFSGFLKASTDEEMARQLGIIPGRTITNFSDFARKRVTKEGARVFTVTLEKPDPTFTAEGDVVIEVAFDKVGFVELIPVRDTLAGMFSATNQLIGRFVGEFE